MMNKIDISLMLDSLTKIKPEIDRHMKYDMLKNAAPEKQREGIYFEERDKELSLEEAQKVYLTYARATELGFTLEDVKRLYEKVDNGLIDNPIPGNIQEELIKFHSDTKSIISLFKDVLKNPNFKGHHYISIVCMDAVYTDKVLAQGKKETGLELNGFYQVEIPVNYSTFMSLPDYEKKKETLELLMTGIRKIAAHLHWDMKPFEEAYDYVVEANYKNEQKQDAPRSLVKHRTRALSAGIGTFQDIGKSEFFVFVCDDKKNELYRETLALPKVLGHYLSLLNTKSPPVKWQGENKIVLSNSLRRDMLKHVGDRENLDREEILSDKDYIKELEEQPSEWTIIVPSGIITKAPLKSSGTAKKKPKNVKKNFQKSS